MSAPAPVLERQPAADRLQRARAALSAAERSAARWGSQLDRTALRPTALPIHEKRPEASSALAEGKRFAVPEALLPLFPGEALRAGSSVAVSGGASSSLLLALAAAASRDSAWCAITGMENLGLRCAIDAGLDPARLALAPLTDQEQRPAVLSALVDGVGVLMLGPDLELAPSLWRTLCDRARTRNTLLLAAAPPGRADLRLHSDAHGWIGLGAGSGRLRRRRVRVSAQGRGIAGERTIEVLLPQVNELLVAVTRPAADDHMQQTPAAAPAPVPLRAVRRAS